MDGATDYHTKNEVSHEERRQIPYGIPYIRDLNMTDEPIYETESQA